MSWMTKCSARMLGKLRNNSGSSMIIAMAWLVACPAEPLTFAAEPQCACPSACLVHPHVRAGCPRSIAWWAQPSNTAQYGGYYVGGSTQIHGDTRCPNEGVWGWDSMGLLFNKHVWLGWAHGPRHYAGEPAYKTDGPHVISHE